MANTYKDLIVWQRAMDFVIDVYRATDIFPDREKFGLTSQLRRAAVSVASNIAEGQGRLTSTDFRHFLGNSRGSLLECETQIILAGRLGLINRETGKQLLQATARIGQLTNKLMQSLDREPRPIRNMTEPR